MTNKKEHKILRKTLSLALTMLVSILGLPLAKPQQVSATEASGAKYLSSITMNATASSSWDKKYSTSVYNDIINNYDNYTSSSPLKIDSAEKLAAFAGAVNVGKKDFSGKYVKLTAPIDLKGGTPTVTKTPSGNKFSLNITGTASNVWVPIGNITTRFKGNFDGDGHEVSNMTVLVKSTSGNTYAGLFGYIYGGSIKNTGVTGNVYAYSSASSSASAKAGGLVGYSSSSSSISNSYATGNVYAYSASASAGGLAGSSSGSSISNSYATGNVYASNSYPYGVYAGGLVGDGSGISNSYATGNVYASSSSSSNVYAGGLAGYSNSSSGMSNNYATGNVYASSSSDNCYAGGLVGLQYSREGSISNGYATGDVYASSTKSIYAGGLLGKNDGGSITNGYYYSGATIDVPEGVTPSDDGTGLTMDQMTGTGTGRADKTMTGLSTDNWAFQADSGRIRYLPRLNVITYSESSNPAPRLLGPLVTPTSSDFDFKAPTNLTYNGSQKVATVTATSGIEGMGKITVKYYNSAGTKLTSAPTNAGTYTVKIDVAEGDNYEAKTDITSGTWKFTITKANPTIKSISTSVTYKPGLTLKDVPYPSTTGNTPGSWSWTSSTSTAISSAGTYTYSAKYTPTDTTNYNSVAKSITVTVNKATPTISSTSTTATYAPSLTLAKISLPSTTGNTPGSWAWSSSSTAISSAGTYTYSAKYTPTDTGYNSVTKSIRITVNKATPTIKSTATSATYAPSLTLAKISLPNTAGNTMGSWAWSNSSTAISNAGTYTYSAKYTPTDTTNYNSVTKSVTVTVNKADPTINSTAASATYVPGLTLAKVSLPSTTGNTAGSWAWSNSSTAISSAGTHKFPAKYTPSSTNYNSVVKDIQITITKDTPTADDFNFAPPSNLEHSADYKIAIITRKPGIEGIGEPTVKYFTKVNGELTPLGDSSLPTDVGTYYVGINVGEDINYNSASGLTSDNWKFTITPAGLHTYQLSNGSRIYLVTQ